MTVGGILNEAWGLYAKFFARFFAVAAIVYLIVNLIDAAAGSLVSSGGARALVLLLTLIVAGILAGIGIGIGLVLVIVPGLILLTWWCLIVPVIVVEKKGIGESFGRSRELVRGHGWTVFGVVVITGIISVVASGVIQAIFSFLGPFLRYWIGGTIASSIVGPFFAVALTLMFFRLQELQQPAAPPAAILPETPQ